MLPEPYFSTDNGSLYLGDCRTVLKDLPDRSINCCVTSPPYWVLRDYGCDGQIGLEQTPEAYVAEMVGVFREVRRVLRDDGTLWLNLGISYAGSWGDSGHRPERDGKPGVQREKNSKFLNRNGHPQMSKPPTAACCDKSANLSPLLQRVPACGNDGKEPQGFQETDCVYPDLDGEPQAGIQNHHAGISRNDQCAEQDGRLPLKIDHDSGHSDSGQESPCASLHDAQKSTTQKSFCQSQGAFAPEAKALAFQQSPDSSLLDAQASEHTKVCSSGTSQLSPPLVVRTVGKESFFSACQSPNCKGVGKCGLCWCSLAIPSLNVKPKDEINIPHLVAMALQADGWVLRQTIIWKKPNPMPESVTDRCTKAHEYIFLLSKSARYFYDADAIKKPQKECTTERYKSGWNGVDDDGSSGARTGSAYKKMKAGMTMDEAMGGNGMRNKRSVWTVTTKPFSGAHFATFPPDLIEPCILAGCPKDGTIIDPFGGAGTSAMVAEKHNRRWVLCELNEKYAEIAAKRIEAENRQLKIPGV